MLNEFDLELKKVSIIINWRDHIICPNCKKEMQLTKIEDGEKLIYQHNQESNCVLALPSEYLNFTHNPNTMQKRENI